MAGRRLRARPAECCMNVNIIVALRTQNDLRLRVTYQRVVPANAGTHTPRTLVSALKQRPFFIFEARGDGSLRSQGRPAERIVGSHDRRLKLVICCPAGEGKKDYAAAFFPNPNASASKL